MRTEGASAVRVIVVVGFAAFVFVLLAAKGLQRALQPSESERVAPARNASPFDAGRAYEDLRRVVALGPRVAGSEKLAELRTLIKGELAMAGLGVREHVFEAETPIGTRVMVNVVGVIEGTKPGVIILGNHYDTKHLPDFVFVGANDAGSTTAWMLEMARTLGPRRQGRSLWLCFFDGEEAFKEWSETDGIYGSRAFVKHLGEQGVLPEVRVMINVDMIGDCYLGIRRDPGAPAWLTQAIWGKAQQLGYGEHFLTSSLPVLDDHIPFRQAGIPAIDIIDFQYGGSIMDHVKNWHTANDTLDKVCQESLQAVGDVIYHSLFDIEAHLDAGSTGPGSGIQPR